MMLKKYGDVVLIGGAIKDIAFFNKIPKDYDFIIITKKQLNLKLNDNYNISDNAFKNMKIKFDNVICDVFSFPTENEIFERAVRFNLDGLFINFTQHTYNADLFNEGIRNNICKINSNKCINPNKNRDYKRGLSLSTKFNVKYLYEQNGRNAN